jgi:hypothetical protein
MGVNKRKRNIWWLYHSISASGYKLVDLADSVTDKRGLPDHIPGRVGIQFPYACHLQKDSCKTVPCYFRVQHGLLARLEFVIPGCALQSRQEDLTGRVARSINSTSAAFSCSGQGSTTRMAAGRFATL